MGTVPFLFLESVSDLKLSVLLLQYNPVGKISSAYVSIMLEQHDVRIPENIAMGPAVRIQKQFKGRLVQFSVLVDQFTMLLIESREVRLKSRF